ncbi:hypothetical protein LSAT2_033104 [Lamellibrachia satsuma]|nr:hypothetical protein LSAT2_033104 [Lamellibrachia satsuma]
MIRSAISIVGILLWLSYIDDVDGSAFFKHVDSINLIGNEKRDFPTHDVLERHKREIVKRQTNEDDSCICALKPVKLPQRQKACWTWRLTIKGLVWTPTCCIYFKLVIEINVSWCVLISTSTTNAVTPRESTIEDTTTELATTAETPTETTVDQTTSAVSSPETTSTGNKLTRELLERLLRWLQRWWRRLRPKRPLPEPLPDMPLEWLERWRYMCSTNANTEGDFPFPDCCEPYELDIRTGELLCSLNATTTTQTTTIGPTTTTV